MPITASKPTQAYAAWFVWARQKLVMEPERAHLAAAAGRDAQAAGASLTDAQTQAVTAAGLDPAKVALPGRSGFGISWRDPALRAIVFGVACLIVPFFGFYFIVLPVLGLVYSIRALTQSRVGFGIAGLILNGLATLFTAALFFRLI